MPSAEVGVLPDNNKLKPLCKVLHCHNNALSKFISSLINFRFNSGSITSRRGLEKLGNIKLH